MLDHGRSHDCSDYIWHGDFLSVVQFQYSATIGHVLVKMWSIGKLKKVVNFRGAYDALALFLVWFQDHAVSHVFLLASLDNG